MMMKNLQFKSMRKLFYQFVLLSVFTLSIQSSAYAIPSKLYEPLSLFAKILYLVESDYVESVDEQKLIEGAIQGMLNSLDPHSIYLSPEYFKELQVDTTGKFGGIGIELGSKNNILTVVSPIEDTPAFRSGIKAGDKIIRINGKSTKNMPIQEAVRLLRGPQGSKITLTIYREGAPDFKEIHITREIIRIKSVKFEKLENGIGLIRLVAFQTDTTSELKRALNELKTRNGDFKGLILDLRNNPGGLLEQAVQVSDLFLTSGVIVSTKGRRQPEEVHSAMAEDTEPNYPIVILINKGSASASEILAGALQDHKRATVIGETSFGKGSVQTVIELEGQRGLKLTIAKYYTPSGKSIHGIGIKPNFYVTNPKEFEQAVETQPQTKLDQQRLAAIAYLTQRKIPKEWVSKAPKGKKNHEDNGE